MCYRHPRQIRSHVAPSPHSMATTGRYIGRRPVGRNITPQPCFSTVASDPAGGGVVNEVVCLFVEFISRCSMFSPRRGKANKHYSQSGRKFPLLHWGSRTPHSRNHDSERLTPRPPHWQARASRVASQGRQIAAFKTQLPAYVSESVYQHTASINFHGLLVRKHSTLHDQANQAHKLPTLTLYVHSHYITKRDNPYHLSEFQIKFHLIAP